MGEFSKEIREIVGSKGNLASKLALSLLLFVIAYFTYQGITTTPEIINESDSLTYHIPIAQSIAKGNIFNPPDLIKGIGYYPAVGETILALFIGLGIPLNLFNLLGLSLLFILCVRLGKTFKVSNASAIIFAVSIVFMNSVLRLVPAQTIDIWLAVFFVLSLILLKNKDKSAGYFIKLGLAIGFLIGVKYSGLLYALALVLLFGKDLFGKNYLRNLFLFAVSLFITGGFWYLRNYLLTGSPIYPGSLLMFAGHPEFRLQDWYPLKTLIELQGGWWLFTQAMISEYLIWPIAYLVLPLFIIINKSLKSFSILRKLIVLGLVNFGVYLFLPSWPENLLSDLRYLFPSIIPVILGLYVLAERLKFSSKLYIIAILTSVSVLSQLAYRPKIIFIWLLFVLVFLFRRNLAKLR